VPERHRCGVACHPVEKGREGGGHTARGAPGLVPGSRRHESRQADRPARGIIGDRSTIWTVECGNPACGLEADIPHVGHVADKRHAGLAVRSAYRPRVDDRIRRLQVRDLRPMMATG
jgi:hypothetical protein